MSTHTITAELDVTFHIPGMPDDERESAQPTIEIEYSFVQGSPATGPTFDSGGEPAAADEVDLVSAKLIDGDGLDPDQCQIDDWARDWLNDAGYREASAHAKSGPDPDFLMQQRIDDEQHGFQAASDEDAF